MEQSPLDPWREAVIEAGKATRAVREPEETRPCPVDGRVDCAEHVAWDPREPSQISPAQITALRKVHEKFCRVLSNQLSQLMRGTQVRVEEKGADQVRFEEYIGALNLDQPAESYIAVVLEMGTAAPESESEVLSETQEAGAARAFIIAYDRRLVFSVIDRMMGGTGSIVVPVRGLTEVEETALARLNGTVQDALQTAWQQLDTQIRFGPSKASANQVALPPEVTAQMTFKVGGSGTEQTEAERSDEVGGLIFIGFPYASLEALLPKLTPSRFVMTTQDDRMRRDLRESIGRLEFDLELVVGEAQRRAAEVDALEEGAVIELDSATDDALRVYIDRYPRYLASLGALGERLAMRVEKILDAEEQEAPPRRI